MHSLDYSYFVLRNVLDILSPNQKYNTKNVYGNMMIYPHTILTSSSKTDHSKYLCFTYYCI